MEIFRNAFLAVSEEEYVLFKHSTRSLLARVICSLALSGSTPKTKIKEEQSICPARLH